MENGVGCCCMFVNIVVGLIDECIYWVFFKFWEECFG